VTEVEVERAKQDPPPGTRAAARARHIREFAGNETLRVNWDTVTVGAPGSQEARTIDLTTAAGAGETASEAGDVG
jgi:hypothetical protein